MSPARRRLIIGLMSGTSRDAVDAAAVSITGSGLDVQARLIHHQSIRYPRTLRRNLSLLDTLTTADICQMNVDVGEVFARAAIKCAQKANIPLKHFEAIASHGQTIWHIPPKGRGNGSTMQIGEPAVIALRTGLPVVSCFRAADMAEGGHGAPLVPYADYILFKKMAPIAVHNLGGISNVTLITPELEGVRAFDTGPGNCLMDLVMQKYFKKPYDRAGATARRGKPDKALLRHLLAHPYFKKKPPKSTGLETFGTSMLKSVLPSGSKVKGEDLLATLAQFTAHSIASAYRSFILPDSTIGEVIFSGGGTKNTFLMRLLGEHLLPLKISMSDAYGIPAQAKEALAFAVLGAARLDGRKTSLPAVTGASKSLKLGSITMP